jgi:hypothetical protein
MRTVNTAEFWTELSAAPRAPDRRSKNAAAAWTFPGSQPAARPLQRGRRFDARPTAWLSLGFAAGVIAWHAVGFWSFVTTTVLHEQSLAVASYGSSPIFGTPSSESLASGRTFVPDCIALASDRTTKVTTAGPCIKETKPLRDAGRNSRTDQLSPVGAQLRSGPSRQAHTDPVQDLKISTGSFDLDLSHY